MITPWYPTEDAPESGLFVAREAEALAAGNDVHVLHLDWSGRRARRTAAVTGVVARRVALSRADPLSYVRARRIVRRAADHAQIVHTHALTGLLPWWLGRPAPRPWVHTEHWSALTAPQTAGRSGRMLLRMLSRVLARPDVVITECERLATAVRAHRVGPVVIVPCVVPPVPVVDPPATGPALIGIGGLIDRKDPLLAVQTTAALRRRGLDATLTWVGDGPLRAAVAAEAAELSIAPYVVLTGALPASGVAQQLDASTLLLLPTRGDNFCVVAAEALVHGRPIVSGAATGAVDYARPAVSRFVSDRSAEAYADAVESLLAGAAALSAVDVAATVAGRFTPDAVRRALEDVYHRMPGSS